MHRNICIYIYGHKNTQLYNTILVTNHDRIGEDKINVSKCIECLWWRWIATTLVLAVWCQGTTPTYSTTFNTKTAPHKSGRKWRVMSSTAQATTRHGKRHLDSLHGHLCQTNISSALSARSMSPLLTKDRVTSSVMPGVSSTSGGWPCWPTRLLRVLLSITILSKRRYVPSSCMIL